MFLRGMNALFFFLFNPFSGGFLLRRAQLAFGVLLYSKLLCFPSRPPRGMGDFLIWLLHRAPSPTVFSWFWHFPLLPGVGNYPLLFPYRTFPAFLAVDLLFKVSITCACGDVLGVLMDDVHGAAFTPSVIDLPSFFVSPFPTVPSLLFHSP